MRTAISPPTSSPCRPGGELPPPHVAVGVRVEDLKIEKSLNTPHKTFKLNYIRTDHQDGFRKPMAACIGPLLKVANNDVPLVRPRVDRNDAVTTATGVIKRFAIKPPDPDKRLLNDLERFVAGWLKENLKPISCDADYEFEHWIGTTNYSLARKEELTKLYQGLTTTPERREFLVKMFVKDEGYDTFKHARGINSRTDEFKVRVGPIFKLIEREVFKLPCFIKKIPLDQRAEYILSMMGENGPFLVSDYTAFESLFTREIMSRVEMQLYQYMTSQLPSWWFDLVSKVLLGRNKCESKYLCVEILCKRMSGEMCTSLGNGFSNWMFINFVCQNLGTKVIGVVEGDDGLFKLDGPIPTEDDFAKLGLMIKLEEHKSIGTTSFCGMLFHENAMDVIADPRKILAEFGWFSTRYTRARPSLKMMLLRAKSCSLRAQYPNCPIVRSLAEYGLRMTRSYSVNSTQVLKSFDVYKREEFLRQMELRVKEANVHIGSRILVEECFGISISEQLCLERYFTECASWVWNLPISLGNFSETWSLYGGDFCFAATKNGKYPFLAGPRGTPEQFPEVLRPHLRI